MDPLDLEIRKRLDKLKEPVINVPSDDELQSKLRGLKGLPEKSDKKYIILPKPRSDTEQVDDLLKQYSEERDLDITCSSSEKNKVVSLEELERRFYNLKSQNPEMKSSEEPLRDRSTKSLVKKLVAEAKLDEQTDLEFPHLKFQENISKKEVIDHSESDSEEEFCCMCHYPPKWICLNCDKDEFCNKCYKLYHDELGESHKRKPIKRRKKKPSISDSDDSD